MRTFVLVGFLFLADAIRTTQQDKGEAKFAAWLVILAMAMDLVEFFANILR